MYPGAEWETEYPMFQAIEDAFRKEIANRKKFGNDDFLRLVVQAIAIDNESERLADFATNTLCGDDIDKIFDTALMSGFTDAQWQLASRVLKSDSQRKVDYLRRFLNEGKNDYVRDRAEYALKSLGNY